MYQLWVLGALDNTGELTETGKKNEWISMWSIIIKNVNYVRRTWLYFGNFGKLRIYINISNFNNTNIIKLLYKKTIVSMLSVPNVFYRPKERAEESDSAREKFFVPESDHLTLLHVYTQWKANGYVIIIY